MIPGYHKFINLIALKGVMRPPSITPIGLAMEDSELLAPIVNGKPVLSQPMQTNYGDASTGGVLVGQTYFGVSGFGSLIPDITPGDIPYYGESTGGE